MLALRGGTVGIWLADSGFGLCGFGYGFALLRGCCGIVFRGVVFGFSDLFMA